MGRLAHNQIIELLNRQQVAVVGHQNRIGKQLIAASRWAAYQTTDGDAVLALDSVDDLVGRQLVRRELVGIHKQPEGRIAATQQVHLGNARHPFQLVVELLIDQTIDIGRIKLTLG